MENADNILKARVYGSMNLCVSGNAEILIGSRFFEVKRGTLWMDTTIAPASVYHQSEDFSVKQMRLDEALVCRYTAMGIRYNFTNGLNLMLDDVQINSFCVCTDYLSHVQRLLKEKDLPSDEHLVRERIVQTLSEQIILQLILWCMSHEESQPMKIDSSKGTYSRFAENLTKHYMENRLVSYYAELEHMSPDHFTRVIKRYSGRTPSEWITLTTIQNIQLILATTDLPIKEISDQMGFPDQFTFGKYFKHHTGVSPREYRDGIRKK